MVQWLVKEDKILADVEGRKTEKGIGGTVRSEVP